MTTEKKAMLIHECRRLVRFGMIGVITVGLYYFLYLLFSRWLWVETNRTFLNISAMTLACTFNFFAHRRWTFRSSGNHRQEIFRYIVVAVTAVLLEGVLFWVGHRLLRIHDLVVAILVPAIIPLYTYVMHRFYTFRSVCVIPLPPEKAL